MNKKYLLSSVTAGIALLYANEGMAQCLTTQDCASLGYTESSCPNGNGVKCPFGNKWSCAPACGSAYKYTCTGSNITGGAGNSCDGKYKACSCASGYEWKDGACKQSAPDYSNCVIGALYYSDGTCSNDYIANKELLGIVIYEKTTSQSGWVMAPKAVALGVGWGQSTTTGITSTAASSSCANTQKLLSRNSPAADYANRYDKGGKTWCLPSYDVLNNLNNKTNFTKVNNTIRIIQSQAGSGVAEILGTIGEYESELIWSSSEYNNVYAWSFFARSDGSFSMNRNYKNGGANFASVRPVMEF